MPDNPYSLPLLLSLFPDGGLIAPAAFRASAASFLGSVAGLYGHSGSLSPSSFQTIGWLNKYSASFGNQSITASISNENFEVLVDGTYLFILMVSRGILTASTSPPATHGISLVRTPLVGSPVASAVVQIPNTSTSYRAQGIILFAKFLELTAGDLVEAKAVDYLANGTFTSSLNDVGLSFTALRVK